MLTNIFAGSVYLGVMVAYFSNWGAAINLPGTSRMQWVAPQTTHIGFAGLILILSFTVKETPRYLVMSGQGEKALENLCILRQLPADHPFIQSELLGVREQLEREKEATMGASRWGKFRELTMIPANRYRFMLGIMSQLLGQWSGASAITIYAATFFATLGKTGQSEKLFATCILGVVKLCSAYLCALFLIDFFGRRRSLYTGIALQTAAILYVAIFLAIVPSDTLKNLALSGSQKHAATAAIAAIYVSGFGWVSHQYLHLIPPLHILIFLLGNGLELLPISRQRRGLPGPPSCTRQLNRHVLPLRQPIRQHQSSPHHAVEDGHVRLLLLLHRGLPHGPGLGVVLRPGDPWPVTREHGRAVQLALVSDWPSWKKAYRGC